MDHGDGWVVTADLIFAFVPGCTTFCSLLSRFLPFSFFWIFSSCSFPLPPLGSCFSCCLRNLSFLPSFHPNLFLTACHINFAPFSTLLPPPATCHLPAGQQDTNNVFPYSLSVSELYSSERLLSHHSRPCVCLIAAAFSYRAIPPLPANSTLLGASSAGFAGARNCHLCCRSLAYCRLRLKYIILLAVLSPRIDIESFHENTKHDRGAKGEFSAVYVLIHSNTRLFPLTPAARRRCPRCRWTIRPFTANQKPKQSP
ncbi:hypothetical protein B0T10DRAFT_4048 [Thelonectria olida]|uniref:Uncharacterized protein n=1 Tax=Thelonectria olida TaxID=1576542 RepID=A0A9P9AYY9_9HYPO|nr:hypothetical protein B0T10DRAFT_4048 [Thelonectria olida]